MYLISDRPFSWPCPRFFFLLDVKLASYFIASKRPPKLEREAFVPYVKAMLCIPFHSKGTLIGVSKYVSSHLFIQACVCVIGTYHPSIHQLWAPSLPRHERMRFGSLSTNQRELLAVLVSIVFFSSFFREMV